MGRGKKVTIGYKYYLDMHMGLCRGPVDELVAIEAEKKDVWKGSATDNSSLRIDKPDLFGGDKKEGGINGTLDVLMGGPDQVPTPGLIGLLKDNVPGFRGFCSLFYSGQVSAMNWNIKPWKVRVRRYSAGWDGPCWNPQWAKILMNDDQVHAMNPAHIIYECLTNRDWGGGLDRSRLHETSFHNAAVALAQEGFGLCLRWTRQESVAAFIQEILNHIAGNLYLSRFDGLIHLTLLRGGYDPAALPAFTPNSGLLGLDDDDATAASGAANEVIIKWFDPVDNKARQSRERSIAAIQSDGAIHSVTIDFPGIPTADLAGRVAARELAQRASGLKQFKVRLDRRAYRLEPGALFRISDPRRGLDNIVLRAGRVEAGTLTDATITISAVQDMFGMPATAMSAPEPGLWSRPDTLPRKVELRRIVERTWRDLAREQGEADLATIDPGASYIASIGVRPTPSSLSYHLVTRVGTAGFAEQDSDSFCPSVLLADAVGKFETLLKFSNPADLDLVTIGTAALLGEEVVRIDAINLETGEITVGRGCIDTVPASHEAGTRVWFYDDGQAVDATAYGVGVDVDVKMLTQTGSGVLHEADAPLDTIKTNLRQGRPYPPGQVRVGGELEPVSITGVINVSWAHRDRKLQADRLIDVEADSIGPEPGVTYGVRVLRKDTGVQIFSQMGISGAAAQIDPLPYTGRVILELRSVQDMTVDSWQLARVEFGYAPDNLPISVVADTADTTAGESVSGNVLDNDSTGLTVTAVNCDSALVGQQVFGSGGGAFVISANGSYSFDPNSDFSDLAEDQTRDTSVTYTAGDGVSSASATLTITVTVSQSTTPVFARAYYFNGDLTDSLGGPPLVNNGMTVGNGYIVGTGIQQWVDTADIGFHENKIVTVCCWAELQTKYRYYQFLFGDSAGDLNNRATIGLGVNFYNNKVYNHNTYGGSTVEDVGVPVFVSAVIDRTQNKLKLYRNAELIHDGGSNIGSTRTAHMQIGGYKNYAFSKGAKIYSIEIADQELTQEEIQILYARGLM